MQRLSPEVAGERWYDCRCRPVVVVGGGGKTRAGGGWRQRHFTDADTRTGSRQKMKGPGSFSLSRSSGPTLIAEANHIKIKMLTHAPLS